VRTRRGPSKRSCTSTLTGCCCWRPIRAACTAGIAPGGASRRADEAELSRSALKDAVEYVRSHPAVRDVLISGGDPLLLADARLE